MDRHGIALIRFHGLKGSRGGAGVWLAMKQAMLLALLFGCGAARAEDWVSIGKTDGGRIRIYIETSAIQINGAIRYARIRDVFKPHTKNKVGTQPDEWVNLAEAHVGADCDKQTYWEDALVWYYENGDRVQVPAEQISAQWTAINPVKSVDQEMKFICGRKPGG